MLENKIVEKIVDSDLNEEMRNSFLEYSYSVIYARALPDARDGLKPVQRRILYQMSVMNLYPDRPYVKSARVVGDVMGKLHPHGDSAIYDAMVRLAQEWSMRIPMVDGHGNFGSLDNGPAAARYTEARMSLASNNMCADLDEDVVDFAPNYDNKLQEPEVLPSAIPNLLVNGGTGIAVGMATNMAPHNLREVIAGAVYLMNNPEATTDELMRYIPGPDLPGGAKIIGLEPIREAYVTGRGIFQMQAKASIEKIGKKQGIIITELPYQVGPEKVIDSISTVVKNGKIQGIAKADDLTDRHNGTKIQIIVKNGFNPEAILARLFKLTPLQSSFGINNVALVNGAPKTLGLKEILQVWIDHRLDVIRRRCEFRLKARQDRLHLIEGLLIAILDIDEVIQVIRTSDDTPQAQTKLMSVFDLDEIQAQYILDLRLRRLTKFSKIELETEKAKLEEEIKELLAILGDPELLKTEVIKIMHDTAREYGDDRRTVLIEDNGATVGAAAQMETLSAPKSGISSTSAGITLVDGSPSASSNEASGGSGAAKKNTVSDEEMYQIKDTPCYILLSSTGLVVRVVRGPKETQSRPPLTQERTPHDAISASIKTSTRSSFGILTSHGRVIVASALELPEIARGENIALDKMDKNTAGMPKLEKLEINGLSAGISMNNLCGPLSPGETPVTIVELPGTSADGRILDGAALEKALSETKPLAIGTAFGVVKRVKVEVPPHERSGNIRDRWEEILLNEGDSVIGAGPCGDEDEVVFISTDSSLLRFQGKSIRPQGRVAGGMAGIKLDAGQQVQFFGTLSDEELLGEAPGQEADKANPEGPLVLTVAGDSGALPGTQNGFGKLTLFNQYPRKGRATGGVRSQKFLKGQDSLLFAWVGRGDARANTATGTPADFPEIDPRRDGSGKLLDNSLVCIG
jgi:DNA gyrase subunit A